MIAKSSARTATAFAAVTAIALLSSGCGRSTDSASSAEAPKWDPCTAFPESALQGVGMTRKAKQDFPGSLCIWSGPSLYELQVEYITKDHNADWKVKAEDPTDTTVGAYTGHIYHVKGNSAAFMCAVQLKTRGSDVVFTVTNSFYKDEDPCAVATRIATALQSYLPPAQ
ncbi:DUF3558 family protein [Nocardia concava]|uniref:DUF3558 family protein n=1 Tax=Nocardia concava TaxID=257281 RepID=UPI0035716487